MSNRIFDAFANKIANTIDYDFRSQHNLHNLKNEYKTLLKEYNALSVSPIDAMRTLGQFRIELSHLISTLNDEKKENIYLVQA